MYLALGRGNGSAAWSVVNAAQHLLVVDGYTDELRREIYGQPHVGPLMAGSAGNPDLARGIGERVEDGFMVHGSWGFSSNIRRAAWLIAGMSVVEDGEPVRHIALIPRGQYKIADDWNVSGLKGSSSNTAYIEEPVFVPEHRVKLDRFGAPADPELSLEWPSTSLDLAAVSIGLAQGAIDVFVERATKRAPFGAAYKTLAEVPHVQSVIGYAQSQIDLALSGIRYWGDRLDRAEQATDITEEETEKISVVTTFAINEMRGIPNRLCNIMGSSTTKLTNPLGRYARDIETFGLAFRMGALDDVGRRVIGIEGQDGFSFNTSLEKMPLPQTDQFVELTDPWD